MVTSEYYKNFDPTVPPEELVTLLLNDLRSPVISIKEAASLLMTEDFTEEESTKLKAIILSTAQRMSQFLDETNIYLEKRKKLNDTQNDAEG